MIIRMCISSMEEKSLRASFVTLGCKVNQAESEALAQVLSDEGYTIVKETENPDVVIINTCTVTGTGSSKSRKIIRKIAKEHPKSTVVVMGCYSQTKPEEIGKIEGVDIIVGTQERQAVLKHLKTVRERGKVSTLPEQSCLMTEDNKGHLTREPIYDIKSFDRKTVYEELPLVHSESKTRAMIKIQDGCSQFCTYCIIPYARGPSRSRDPENILAEARYLLERGYKEIVLTGVHIAAYGNDLKEKHRTLAELITQLIKLPGMNRLRLGSIEPMEFTPELLEVVTSSEVICPHFHIPLQSAVNKILAKMKRPYTIEEYAFLLEKLRAKLPDSAIAADIMTGFPGETDEDHQQALEFVESCGFASIHVFPYSRREGTPAADMPSQISGKVKAERVRDLIRIGRQSRRRYISKFVGETVEVLIEKIDATGDVKGHTRNYLELSLPADLNPNNRQPGDLLNCILREEYVSFD